MKVSELCEKLEAIAVTGPFDEHEVEKAYTSDLLSDVMGYAEEESLLITIQAHKNTVAVACQLDMPAILICNGRKIPDDMRDAAAGENITILTTKDNQYTASVKVFLALSGNKSVIPG